jgi:lipopolysaccharide transport system ATP-binding protein
MDADPGHHERHALRLSNVGVSYERRHGLFRRQEFWALEDVSFSLFHGETLGVIGRNGAGKSTLLRLLAGIIGPDRGKVERFGCRASLLSLQAGFLPRLTGRENAILSGVLLGLSREFVLERMASIIAFAELEESIDEPLHSYSAGMKARLGFSVAFQADPDILLVDEVLGVGDPEFRQKSATALRERIKSDKTVVLVSHNLDVVRALCDRLVWIKDRRTFQEGPTDEVLQAYQDDVAAKPA